MLLEVPEEGSLIWRIVQSLGFRLLVSVVGLGAVQGQIEPDRRSKSWLFPLLEEIVGELAFIDFDEVRSALGLAEPVRTLGYPRDAVVA